MKYLLFTILTLSILIQSTYSQENNHDKLESLKIGFITQELDLTPKEAQKFWPIYNAHQDEMRRLHSKNKKLRVKIRKNGGFKSITNSEAEKLLNQFIEIENKIQNRKTGLFKDLKSVLPAKKILKLHRAEKDFNRRILERLKKRRENFRNLN